jgi:membrane-bound lytic murein transglycosylase C
MDRRQVIKLLGLAPLGLVIGCKAAQIRRAVNAGSHLARGSLTGAALSTVPGTGVPGVDSLVRAQLKGMLDRLFKEWGDERLPSSKVYVKYTNDYKTRAVINFETGTIRVETVETKGRLEKLQTAIVHTLLTPKDPEEVDLLSDKEVNLGKEPFLYHLILDQDHKPVRWEWRANRFARYLLRTARHEDRYNGRKRLYVSLQMVKDHDLQQRQRYSSYVLKSSREFGVDSALIYAIIEVESSFNPYAMSPAPAYGLMQIVPQTAGRDAYRLVYGRKGTPSREFLFVPAKNIRLGTAYLHLLDQDYLQGILDPKAREYCVIAGYNTGSSNVLRSFAAQREQALARINDLDSQAVYRHLVNNLPYAETRNYLPKVVRARRRYA